QRKSAERKKSTTRHEVLKYGEKLNIYRIDRSIRRAIHSPSSGKVSRSVRAFSFRAASSTCSSVGCCGSSSSPGASASSGMPGAVPGDILVDCLGVGAGADLLPVLHCCLLRPFRLRQQRAAMVECSPLCCGAGRGRPYIGL